GSVAAWMGEGSVMSNCLRTSTRSPGTPSSANALDKGYRYLMWCLTTAATRMISGESRWSIAGVEPLAVLRHAIRIEVRLDDPCASTLAETASDQRILMDLRRVTCDSRPVSDLSPDTVVTMLRAAGCVYAEEEAALLAE